jgi:hypothetical protein
MLDQKGGVAMGEFADRQTAPGAIDASVVREVSTPLFQAKGWMKFLGVLSIIQGILMVFTIWGIIICWLPIWMGVLLFKAGGAVEVAQIGGDKSQMITAMTKLRTYFTVQGVLSLIMIVIMVIFGIVAGGAMLAMLSSGMQNM